MQLSNRTRATFLGAAVGLFSIVGLAAFATADGANATVKCEYYCRDCSLGHDIVQSVHNDVESSHLENCNAGGCSSHKACDVVE